ncbi:MAG: MBL fold metallo-hydrolase [Burkholderiales bacterium]|nr:MBL fold metallo-hydrolase [Burkholderiales bacterium]
MRPSRPLPALGTWLALAGLTACSTTPVPDAQALLRQADEALGASQLKTLSFSGRGTGGTFGQAWQPGIAWPLLNYSVLTRAIDFEAGGIREDFGRSRAEVNGGGAVPLMGQGEQRVSGFARERWAWNAGNPPAPAPVAVEARLHDLWTTPQGAIKAAQRHGATAGTRSEEGVTYRTLSYTVPGVVSATAWVDAEGRITRVDSRMPHPVMGDTEVVTRYSQYQRFGAIQFPMRIQQVQGAWPVLDLQVQQVQPDAAVAIAVPDNVRSATERVTSEQVAPGVWHLTGGSHNSVAIEMSNHLVLVESPLYDGRAAAVLAAARQLVPGKPVRTVINSHHHFDHAGGLRGAAAEGATLITSAMAKPYFERVFANPNTVAPDRLAQSGRKPEIIGVQGRQVLVDGERRVEIHELQGSVHAQGFLMVYLPKEKLLIEADAYTPGPPNSPPPPVPNANHVNLVQNIERLGLQVERIVPLHSRLATLDELYAQIGRKR